MGGQICNHFRDPRGHPVAVCSMRAKAVFPPKGGPVLPPKGGLSFRLKAAVLPPKGGSYKRARA
jgi:hypothetical protein